MNAIAVLLIFGTFAIFNAEVSAQGLNPLTIVRTSPTQFQLSWYARTLRPYQIENSEDLVNWMEFTSVTEGTNAQKTALVNKTADRMFFRLKTGAVRPVFNSKSLAPGDDANYSDLEDIGFPINVFPTPENPGPWTGCFVNDNGNISIGTHVGEFNPQPLQTVEPIPKPLKIWQEICFSSRYVTSC